MKLAMVQDKIVPLEKLNSAYLDRGTFFGDGVYEVVRSYNGRIFALNEHLQRLSNGLKAIDITGVNIEEVRDRVIKAFETAAIENAGIYFHITRGSALREHNCDNSIRPNFFLTITPLADQKIIKQNGIKVATHPDWRWKRCDIKSLNLLPNVLAKQAAAKKGCDEAILVKDDGAITEGASSAFFAVIDGKLRTTPQSTDILPSITRKYVLKAARNIGLQVLHESVTPAEAAGADELFIAVTTKDIVAVVKLDDTEIGDGGYGVYTKKIQEQFRLFTS